MRSLIDVELRLWMKVRCSDGCWEWCGYADPGGYGRISIGKHRPHTHRVMWEVCFGDIPPGLFVCHKCDNRRCVRPDHLFLGTPHDNAQDMVQKGRSQKGESHARSKLTASDILEIRRLVDAGEYKTVIGERFGIHNTTVGQIARKERWSHVE